MLSKVFMNVANEIYNSTKQLKINTAKAVKQLDSFLEFIQKASSINGITKLSSNPPMLHNKQQPEPVAPLCL